MRWSRHRRRRIGGDLQAFGGEAVGAGGVNIFNSSYRFVLLGMQWKGEILLEEIGHSPIVQVKRRDSTLKRCRTSDPKYSISRSWILIADIA